MNERQKFIVLLILALASLGLLLAIRHYINTQFLP